MKKFMDENFLLKTKTAEILYHRYAKSMPILDYHCHLDPQAIYENKPFRNLTELWLAGDHYKWRLMRSHGIEERKITGDASDWEKFVAFASVLPRCIGNPMYHWCHLELKKYFGYDGVINEETADEIWQLTSKRLSEDASFTPQNLIIQSNVAMIGTTDDPCSDLFYHEKLAASSFSTAVLPSFRPDPALQIHKNTFASYIQKLRDCISSPIESAEDVAKALCLRIAYFNDHGCRAADHGLDDIVYQPASIQTLNQTFQKAMKGLPLTSEEIQGYQTYLLQTCAREYHRYNWAMQLHFGCIRNPNSKMFNLLGPDTGFDVMGASCGCRSLSAFLDSLEQENHLPKTILYSLNPTDNAWLDTVLGAFQDRSIPGKMQHGSAWWFNDHNTGMRNQLTSLANLSVLGNFIGMLTDSRSFLSYTRHEYFRRILCDFIGDLVENGEYPDDISTLGKLVQDICYYNAKRYFRFEEKN